MGAESASDTGKPVSEADSAPIVLHDPKGDDNRRSAPYGNVPLFFPAIPDAGSGVCISLF